MAEVLDYGFKVSEFELQLCYYFHFWKGMNTLIPQQRVK